MRSPLLDRPGAVGEAVARHYGEPLREQRLLTEGKAVVDCSDWSVLRLSGPDRLNWLDAISSQQFVKTPVGDTREGLILDPHGRVEHRFLLVDDGESAWLLTEPGSASALESWLLRVRFRHEVTIADVSGEWATLAAISRPAGDTVEASAHPAEVVSPVRWRDDWPALQPGGAAYSANPHPAEGLSVSFWLVPRAELTDALSPDWAGSDALEAIWVSAGRPRLVGDVDDKTIPHELDWLRTAVHLDKGCYRGQETVAKVHNLGHPPRRLTLLHLDGSGSQLPAHGAEVFSGDTAVGRVTRSALHFEWGPIALALLKRSLDPTAELVVAGPDGPIAAHQEVLVLPEAGATRREALRARKPSSSD